MVATRAKPSREIDVSPTFGLSPMLASLGELPEGDDWVYEVKWDGVRVLARVDRIGRSRRLILTSRNGNDITARYPELVDLAHAIPARSLPVLLDGEVVAFDGDGRPNFGLLQQRMHLSDARRVAALADEHPVKFAIFDLLAERGEQLTMLPWEERRARLEKLGIAADHASVPGVYDDGAELLDRMIERGMEGVVAKRRDGAYRPGKRGRGWTKIKPKPRQEFVVGGWTEGAGRRTGSIGALLLGYFDDDALRYVGNVGSGFDDADLVELDQLLAPLGRATSPFESDVPTSGAHFVRPTLVAEIEYGELTGTGHLRHPVYMGLRDDKPARDVTFERKK
jgi:bifunctional non-homologous end joining protein LigD